MVKVKNGSQVSRRQFDLQKSKPDGKMLTEKELLFVLSCPKSISKIEKDMERFGEEFFFRASHHLLTDFVVCLLQISIVLMEIDLKYKTKNKTIDDLGDRVRQLMFRAIVYRDRLNNTPEENKNILSKLLKYIPLDTEEHQDFSKFLFIHSKYIFKLKVPSKNVANF